MPLEERLYQIALTQVPGIGTVQAKQLIETVGSASEIFKMRKNKLGLIEGIGEMRAAAIKNFIDFAAAEEELEFCKKHNVQMLFLGDENYPSRLMHCYDAPTLLYFKGNAELNAQKIVAVVGTRHHTEYGKQLTEKLVEDLSELQVLVVSGLAFGIDSIAHKASLKHQLPTVGVMGNGLSKVYPSVNKPMAKEMVLQGGLLTEFGNKTLPDKHNFPRRNRVVAGMADAVIVIETAEKGGSMITAELAGSYNRDVFAYPGKTTDIRSGGCNRLIQQNKAQLVTSAQDVIEAMGWQKKKSKPKAQRSLFIELSSEEKLILNSFKEKEQVHIDELYFGHSLTGSSVAAAILNLELQGVIKSLPGKIYTLV